MDSRFSAHVRSNVVGYVALFVALGGVAYALETDSVRSKHIKDGQVRTGDVADDSTANALTGADIASETLGTADIDESALGGFDPDEVGPRAYARVEAGGDVTDADSKGLTDATVLFSSGVYCFETGFDVNTITGVVDSGTGPGSDRIVEGFNQGGPPCGVNDDAMVFIYDISSAAPTSATFYVEIN